MCVFNKKFSSNFYQIWHKTWLLHLLAAFVVSISEFPLKPFAINFRHEIAPADQPLQHKEKLFKSQKN
jgi:hypothetical protein